MITVANMSFRSYLHGSLIVTHSLISERKLRPVSLKCLHGKGFSSDPALRFCSKVSLSSFVSPITSYSQSGLVV